MDEKEKNLQEEITSEPTKKVYTIGKDLVLTGLEIKATYNDESTKEIENYEIADGENLEKGKETVTIRYKEKDITKEVLLPITVIEKALTKIEVEKAPSKISYIEGQNFEKEGMTVKATYNDALQKEKEKEEKALAKERRMQEAILNIKEKFGKNALLRGVSFQEGATARERNKQIGGHHE